MRLVVEIKEKEKAERFALFLREKNVPCQLEACEALSQIWVFDEDDFEKAKEAFEQFNQQPNWTPSFETLEKMRSEEQIKKQEEVLEYAQEDPSFEQEAQTDPEQDKNPQNTYRPKFGKLTLSITFLCIGLFLWSLFSAPPKIDYAGHTLNISSTYTIPYNALTYEYPLAFQYAYEFALDYEKSTDKAAFLKTTEAFNQLYRYQTTPYWHGYYETYFVPHQTYRSLNKAFAYTPSFEQIGQGEVWRLVTPAFLHANLFHILFNLLWFVFLGNQMESRIGFWKFALFIAIVAVISNTAQYLMSGPNFLGLSGVVLGQAGFIYARQAKAAWEGYSTQRSTLYFLAFYVLALVVLQVVSFFIELSGKAGIAPNIANTAHVIGALCGLALGSLNFFSAWNLDKLKK